MLKSESHSFIFQMEAYPIINPLSLSTKKVCMPEFHFSKPFLYDASKSKSPKYTYLIPKFFVHTKIITYIYLYLQQMIKKTLIIIEWLILAGKRPKPTKSRTHLFYSNIHLYLFLAHQFHY